MNHLFCQSAPPRPQTLHRTMSGWLIQNPHIVICSEPFGTRTIEWLLSVWYFPRCCLSLLTCGLKPGGVSTPFACSRLHFQTSSWAAAQAKAVTDVLRHSKRLSQVLPVGEQGSSSQLQDSC
jgi:hypothetical protein